MKALFKWLLITLILLVGIYTAAPLWLPQVLKSQLPDGWEIEQLEIGYPGIKNIQITSLSLRGNTLVADVDLSATQVRFNYQSRKLEIGSLLIDVLLNAETGDIGDFSLEDVSLPLLKLPDNMSLPEIVVQNMQLQLRGNVSSSPLLLNFDSIRLLPSGHQRLQLLTAVHLSGYSELGGQLEIEVSDSALHAGLVLSSTTETSPWFNIILEQEFQAQESHSEITFQLNANGTGSEWLNRLVAQLTSGQVQQIEGQAQLLAIFSGDNQPESQQEIKQFRLELTKLELKTSGEKLQLDVELLGMVEPDKLTITQGDTLELQYSSTSSEGLLQRIFPEFQYPTDVDTAVDIRLHNLQLEVTDITRLDQSSASGLVEIDWQEKHAFVYQSAEIKLQASKLEFGVVGELDLEQQRIHFESLSELEIKMDQLQLDLISEDSRTQINADSNHTLAKLGFNFPLSQTDVPVEFTFNGSSNSEQAIIKLIEKGEVQTRIHAQTFPLSTVLSSKSEQLLSNGQAKLLGAEITLVGGDGEIISAKNLNLSWDQLDINKQTGQLELNTKGLELIIDGESWQGFELSLKNRLKPQGELNGSGEVLFLNGPSFPLEYQGNLENRKWEITIPATHIDTKRLPDLLAIARIEWPVSLVAGTGSIEVSAEISVADSIRSSAKIRGGDLEFSVLENSLQGGSVDVQIILAEDLTLKGSVSLAGLEVAGGLGVDNIRTELQIINTDSLQASLLELQLFGGRLKPAGIHYSAGLLADSLLEFIDIDLHQLLVFADFDGLTGSGSLDIQLPIGSDSGGLYVKNATFSSSAPGYLAYLSGTPGSNIGLQALENFQYQSLSGTLDYQSNGNYQVLIRLNGSNPDLYDGHPISFNLTINGVLPELFEALFITGSFEEGIIKQIRSQ
ncbi:MAG: YdbH domain-containing protein [Xanthomonadales bacterium]|nr:YdbH domain-containing protein [Xanthomonadales bacterium]